MNSKKPVQVRVPDAVQRALRAAKAHLSSYSPTVGMSNVTQANQNILINFSAEAARVNLQFFSIEPATPLRVTLKRGDAVLLNDAVKADPKNGNRISAGVPPHSSGEQVQLTIRTAEGKELIAAETQIK